MPFKNVKLHVRLTAYVELIHIYIDYNYLSRKNKEREIIVNRLMRKDNYEKHNYTQFFDL